ncbi:MAG: DUF4974 domain-containing protein [Marinilabiliaceae bacterium]|nr:DUF4974 domain-containing protein [Marinilabiliaceae bacterium]
MKKEILIKFLNNQCSEKELDEIIQWINTESMNKVSIDWVHDVWESCKESDREINIENFNVILNKIQEKTEFENKVNKRSFKYSGFINQLYRAAAIILIPLLALSLYTLSQKKQQLATYANFVPDSLEVITPYGSKTKVQLSDGTEVYLNYGSSLKYPRIFSGKTREVILSGEGYFNVATNHKIPFVVNVGGFKVNAVGTSFNVSANPDNNIIETTLIEGKVVLKFAQENGSDETIGIMEPGQHLKYNIETGAVSSTKGNVEKFVAWKEGKLIFEDTPITQVAEKLGSMFNVDIEISDNAKDYNYTVTFIDEPLFQILDLMTIATPIKYTAFPREKLPDGSYSKQKIIIDKN